ncbi:unnamed protein product [Rhizoctonia solani]|uniref:Uncharacterized protein n=1 Tax=Rhizoctonia solani TaxID=456999 RepID=A0A8H3D915_9AGAM|nr:unnamed protein product [Rhizoctonia solani]
MEHTVPFCHTCETECNDITRHLFSYHTQPEAISPGMSADAGGLLNEFEPEEAEDEQTFCLQCSREFHTAAALAVHLSDTPVHNRMTQRARVSLVSLVCRVTHLMMPQDPIVYTTEAPGHQQTWIMTTRTAPWTRAVHPHKHSRFRDEATRGAHQTRQEMNFIENAPHTTIVGHRTRQANSAHQPPEFSSEEFDSESDEDDDMSTDAGYPNTQNHSGMTSVPSASHYAQYSRPRGFVTGDVQSSNPPYAPGAYAFMSPQPAITSSGANAYAQEGMSREQPTTLKAIIQSFYLNSIGVMFLPLVTLALMGTCTAFQLKNLVTFGDSYTDNTMNGDAGYRWPDHVAFMSNGSVSVYDFAHSGATCSNKLTPRIYRPVLEAQIPEYFANVTVKATTGKPRQNTTYIIGKNGTYVPLASKDTMYSIWIGTNDVGVGALLTDPLPDVSIVNTTECVFDWVQELYNKGARNFLIQNMTPMWLLPMYAPNGYDTKYWNSPHNQTEWSIFIAELVRAGNELQALRTKYIAPGRFPGARFGMFDSHRLFKDMYYNPQDYLVGPTYNVSGVIQACRYPYGNNTLVCETEPPAVRDSYLWWNELHPSEQAHKVVARNVLDSLSGKGPFVQWYGAK